ncbi:MAG TPA: hypothetical protein VMT19_07235 [Thermoanaerobaculaceae bacterium]|nr:hypothetical protein [Thermoanaerobaculaceae bacterium]
MTSRRVVPLLVVLVAGGGLLLAAACSRAPAVVLDGISAQVVAALEPGIAEPAPDLVITSIRDGAVVPADLAFPLVEWRSEREADAFLLRLRSGRTALDVVLRGKSWRPREGEFERFLERGEVVVTVYRLAAGHTDRSGRVRLAVARRRLGQRIAFRVVQPLFNPALPNELVVWGPAKRAPETVLRLEGTCVGCHAYAAGSVFLNLKRGGERRLAVVRRTGTSTRVVTRDLGQFSFLAPSPDGDHAVFVNAPAGDLVLHDTPVEPFDYPYRAGDIFVLDARTGRSAPLPGAADPEVVEDMPSFSPDGSRVVFSRYRFDATQGVNRVPSMELAEVPFNGGRGGDAKAVAGASGEGTWNYFARYTPDGKWISFCRGDASRGVYARLSSDICLVPAGGGEARRLRLNVEDAMDSWHSWSADSHWLAFSSNREGSGMTALYLAYVDDDGIDYPPVKLVGLDGMKVNTPQFVPAGLPLDGGADLAASVRGVFADQ